MAQPSGQVLLDTGSSNYAATSFWYCDGTNLWDAKAGATLTKTGTAGVAVEGGANVVLGNGSTYYALASALTLPGDYTIHFKARLNTAATTSMVFGSRSVNTSYFWLYSAANTSQLRATIPSSSEGESFTPMGSVTTMADYMLVRSGTNLSLYKDNALISTQTHGTNAVLTITHIMSGQTNASFMLNGALEFLRVVSGVAWDSTARASYYADPYLGLAGGSAQNITVPLVDNGATAYAPVITQSGGVQNITVPLVDGGTTVYSPTVSLSGTGSITLTSPVAHQGRQRSLTTGTASFTVAGTYTGTPASIQYRFAGGAWSTLIASPSGGAFTTTVALPTGQGTFEVRFSNDTGVTDSAAYVTVGDCFITAGQSNHVGTAPNLVHPVASTFTAVMYDRSGVWKPLQEGDTQATSYDQGSAGAKGSYFGALSNRLQSVGVPVFFIPCAAGSTTISQWQRYDPNPTDPYFLYGDLRQADIAAGGHRAVLWMLGENDATAGQAQSAHETLLNELINDWHADTGGVFFINQIVRWNSALYSQIDAIRAAQAAVAASNPHVAGIVDGNVPSWQAANNIHYQTTTHINDLADVVYAGMLTAFYALRAQLTLTTNGTTPVASLTGIRWAWWDAAPPDLSTAPVDSGTAATTDASGLFSVELTNTTLSSGDTGTLLAIISDGVAGSTANKAFCAPVEVT